MLHLILRVGRWEQRSHSQVEWVVRIVEDKVGNRTGNLVAPLHSKEVGLADRSLEIAVWQRKDTGQDAETAEAEVIVLRAGEGALLRTNASVRQQEGNAADVVYPGDIGGAAVGERDVRTDAGAGAEAVPYHASAAMETMPWLLWEAEDGQMTVLFAKAWVRDVLVGSPPPKPLI